MQVLKLCDGRILNLAISNLAAFVFNEDYQTDSCFLRSDTFVAEPFVLLAADVTYQFLDVFLCVYTDRLVCGKSIIAYIKSLSANLYSMLFKPSVFGIMLVCLLPCVF